MKRHLSIFLFILFTLPFYAQKITVNWEAGKIRDFGENNKVLLPSFTNEGFSFDQNNIFIRVNQDAGERDLDITNFVWQNVAASELYSLNQYILPQDNIASVSYYINKGVRKASTYVALFKNENGVIKRLSSFDIVAGSQALPNTSKIGTSVNPLSTGTFYKIKVDKSGIFKITSQFLQSNGINPASVNPKNFRIYGNGGVMLPEHNQNARYSALQENAIQVVGEDDGVWNTEDYALFYAQGPNGYNLYDQTNGNGFKRTETRTDRTNHLKNIYDDFSYYFINFDKGAGKRVQTQDASLPATLITRYDDYQFVNNDAKNLLKLGRIWVEDPSFVAAKSISFTTKSPIQSGDPVKFRAQVVGYQSQQNSVTFDINGQNTVTQNIPMTNPPSFSDFFPLRFVGTATNLTGTNITINYAPNISTNPNGVFYADYVEVQYKENLSFNGSQMNFRDFSLQSGSGQLYGFSMANANGVEQIWDVTDITNATKKVNKATGGTFNFGYLANDLNFNNEFVAFRADAAFTPTFVGKIDSQNLMGLQNISYLVITSAEMMSQAQRIANHHQTKSNMTTAVVDVEKIYNEFSSGGKDLTALRDFITYLNRPVNSLKYVFLLGDTTYDFKNRTPNNFNIVPGYQSEESSNYVNSFVTDDYIVMTAPQVSSFLANNLPDIPVGRIPAANISEAKTMIDKTLAYYNNLPGQSSPFGTWRMKMDFVVDDDNDGGEPFHNVMNEAIVETFEGATDKPEYNIRKLYLDAFTQQSSAGGPRYPQVNQGIVNAIGNSLYLFYFGHGGINGWAQERVLTVSEIQNSNNYNQVYTRLPLVSTITCEFTLWDEPNTNSAGEQFIKHQQGGTAIMITSSRAIDVGYGINFTSELSNTLFDLTADDFDRLGTAHLISKTNFGPNSNHLKVNFLGDPALKLSRPTRNLVIDNIQTPVPGLIRALDFVKITGHITNPNGTVNTGFNGKVAINIYDKRLNKQTLNNDGGLVPVLQYTEEGSPIVKASGNAVNGLFEVEFYVPNDINYTVGTGRILAYADNKQFDVFNNQPHQIGDINPDGINDNEPPKVRLYMNNTNFADGGITDQNPMLLACITDDTGINSTGSGIGHDITVYLDGQIINTVVLNDFYTPGDGNGCSSPTLKDYQKGFVTYPFRNLAPGEHTLTFKVWDINNNSTTATLRFIVKDESNQNLIVNRLLNWPNPFTDKTFIQFEHNCDDILDVNVQIYTITGKLVRTFSQSVTGEPFFEGFRTPRQAIMWDGRDDFGDTVGKGTYIFKIFARSQNPDKCKGSATAVEKMVILK